MREPQTRGSSAARPRGELGWLGMATEATAHDVLAQVDQLRPDATAALDQARRADMGQFMTPLPVARLMASMFSTGSHDLQRLAKKATRSNTHSLPAAPAPRRAAQGGCAGYPVKGICDVVAAPGGLIGPGTQTKKEFNRGWDVLLDFLTTPPANPRPIGNRSRLARRPEDGRLDVHVADGSRYERAQLRWCGLKAGEVGEAKRVAV